MITKTLLTGLMICTLSGSFGQSPATQAYIEQYAEIAIFEMQRTGVPASIKLAQAIL